jgi:hypothetical protein
MLSIRLFASQSVSSMFLDSFPASHDEESGDAGRLSNDVPLRIMPHF